MTIKIIKNSNTELVNLIKQRLLENDGYCPCALERTVDTKCMCKDFRDSGLGFCHCGLYEKILIDANMEE